MLDIVGELYSPATASEERNGAAVVISHPMTGVKEQTAADHARLLAQAGFYALTFDAGYQGESGGTPRGLEDPHQRAQDNKAAVSYLGTLKRSGRPGAHWSFVHSPLLGGYNSHAAQSDGRVRALATVSAACVGPMTRNGGLHEENNEGKPEAIAVALQSAGQWRTQEANGDDDKNNNKAPRMFSTDTSSVPDDADSSFKDAAAYHGSKRGHRERSDQKVPPMSYDLMVSYDSFNFQRPISPRALPMIAGTEAQTLHFSEAAVDAARGPKELFTIQGRNHFDLYDDLEKSGPRLVEFFLGRISAGMRNELLLQKDIDHIINNTSVCSKCTKLAFAPQAQLHATSDFTCLVFFPSFFHAASSVPPNPRINTVDASNTSCKLGSSRHILNIITRQVRNAFFVVPNPRHGRSPITKAQSNILYRVSKAQAEVQSHLAMFEPSFVPKGRRCRHGYLDLA